MKEKRKARRQPMRYSAWVALTAEERHGCVLSDVSDSGARIEVQDSAVLPEHFLLLLSANGAARRYCHVVWRKPNQVGVKFEAALPESSEATLAPKSDADVPAPDAGTAPAIVEPAKTMIGQRPAPTISNNQACWIADSSQSPPRARMKVHSSVTSLGLPPSTVRPLARSTMLSVSAKRMATVA